MYRKKSAFSILATTFAPIAALCTVGVFFALQVNAGTHAQRSVAEPVATVNTADAQPSARPDAAPLSAQDKAANAAFIQTTEHLQRRAVSLKIGQLLPPFALYDQDARPVLLPQAYQGKFILISFIFTRCQVATMCPAATAKMTAVQRALKQLGLSDKVQLVSITFDPVYDTPEVMHQYAQMFGAKTDNYAFLTGEPQLIDALLKRFGVLTRDSGDTIVHTMTTTLIAPDGALALQERGENWQPETFLKFIQQHLQGS